MFGFLQFDNTEYKKSTKNLVAEIKSIYSLRFLNQSGLLLPFIGKISAEQIRSQGRRGGKVYKGLKIPVKKGNKRSTSGKKSQYSPKPATLIRSTRLISVIEALKAFRLSLADNDRKLNIRVIDLIGLFHQFGTKNRDGSERMIAREILSVTQEDASGISRLFANVNERKLRGFGDSRGLRSFSDSRGLRK